MIVNIHWIQIIQNSKNRRHFLITSAEGFSLLEMLVGLAVTAVVLAAVVNIFTVLTRSYTTQNVAADVQQVVRAAVDYMAQNIRMAGLNPARIPDVGIVSATPTQIEFKIDRNLNGMIDTNNEEAIAYAYDSDQKKVKEILNPGITGSSSTNPLVYHVQDLTFTYLDRNGDPTVELTEIRAVEIFLTVEQSAGRSEPVARTYATRVVCRNLGL
jgi:type IV pilus assembly protein PilW